MSIFAVGDIHGHSKKLKALINKLPLTADDRLIFLGDYIDRGPDSNGVISYLLQLSKHYDSKFLCGNHEHMMRDYMQGCKTYDRELWLEYGGIATLRSYDLVGARPGELSLPVEHRDFITGLGYYHTEPGFVFVHSGLSSGKTLSQNNWKDCLWNRAAFINSTYKWPEGRIVFGHSQSEKQEPIVEDNKIGIDTGCAYGGPLTAVRLPEVEFYQA